MPMILKSLGFENGVPSTRTAEDQAKGAEEEVAEERVLVIARGR